MRNAEIRQLKRLRRYPVPPEALARVRVRVVAATQAAPMPRRGWFAVGAWKPAMAAAAVVMMATGGVTFAAANDALPGERLYVVKVVGEALHERAVFGAERRFVVQAAHAARRLEEAERLLEREGLVPMERAELMRSAMERYENHVFAMNEIAVKLRVTAEEPKRGDRAIEAAEKMMERQARLLESATGVEPAIASVMIDPVGAAVTMEDDLWDAIPADDGGRAEAFERRKERNRKFERVLLRLQDGAREPGRRGDEDRDDEHEDRVEGGKALEIRPET